MGWVFSLGYCKAMSRFRTLKNAVQTNGDGGFIFCPIVPKFCLLTLLIMTKMLIYIFLPLLVSFSRNRQLKTSNFLKNVTFPDGRTDGRNRAQTDIFFFKILTHMHMTHVNFLLHRLLFSETQTDRQDKFVIDIYIYLYIYIYV